MKPFARVAVIVLFALSPAGVALAATTPAVPSVTTVFIEFIVEDPQGRPALNLNADEVVVVQDGVQQKLETLVARAQPGRYELSYVPKSGQGGAVKMQLLRPRNRARGIDTPEIKPRVVAALSPVEAELAAILDSRPDAADFRTQTSVMRFESRPDGLHHTLAVEIPFAELTVKKDEQGFVGRAEIFARVLDAEGRVVHRSFVDRALSAATDNQLFAQRMVWTGQAHLRPGRYTLQTVVRDAHSAKASVHNVAFDAPEVQPGMRLSSVSLLGASNVVRDKVNAEDDPFILKGEPVMPTLELKTVAAPGAKVQFFTIVYPDRASAEPVTLRLELLRDGNIVGQAPITLPAPDERGEIRYAGGLPTRTLPPAEYKLRLHAQQGSAVRYEEVPFSVSTGEGVKPQLQFSDGMPAAPAAQRPRNMASKGKTPPADSDELAQARKLLRRQQYDEAVKYLKKADKAENGSRSDVALLLSVTYYRMRAYKDGETAARRVLELSKDDAPMLAEGYTVLGRILADSEKKVVDSESGRLQAAEEAFRKVLAVSNGASETGHVALAETLYRLDRGDEAKAALKALIEKPGLTEATAERAQMLLETPRCATEACLPRLSFVSTDGKHITPEELKGKVVLLSFWATWCGPCVAAMPELKRLHAKYEKEPFVMVGVNRDNDRSVMEKYVESNRVAWPQISDDASDRLSEAMAVRGIPAEILFDHEGVLVGRTTGWGSETGRALIAEIHQAIGKAKKAQRQASSGSGRLSPSSP